MGVGACVFFWDESLGAIWGWLVTVDDCGSFRIDRSSAEVVEIFGLKLSVIFEIGLVPTSLQICDSI